MKLKKKLQTSKTLRQHPLMINKLIQTMTYQLSKTKTFKNLSDSSKTKTKVE